ncbi:hypothetical protein [Sphingomonas glacialis]|uniref:hypothetical protein n=1 Tax=Sphingomonas glacialis TaxID=658225 RepID=UPI001674FF25|nr:hypothetical protein [Sphingomonas glacialis]
MIERADILQQSRWKSPNTSLIGLRFAERVRVHRLDRPSGRGEIGRRAGLKMAFSLTNRPKNIGKSTIYR